MTDDRSTDKDPVKINRRDILAGAAAGLSVGLFDAALEARETAGKLQAKVPAAYLMHLDEGLQPKTLLGWVREKVRKFAVGV